MNRTPKIRKIHSSFSRHDRNYCIFSLEGSNSEYLFYSHFSRPLRSLMYGADFSGQLPRLMEKADLCIECGLGLSIKGGVALDEGDCIAWNMTIEEANAILSAFRQNPGSEGHWITLF